MSNGAIIELKRGRELVEHSGFRAGPVNDSNVYDHALDAACLVLRKFHGVEGDGKFHTFYGSDGAKQIIDGCKAYLRLELMHDLPEKGGK
jgi:hypothetical protein